MFMKVKKYNSRIIRNIANLFCDYLKFNITLYKIIIIHIKPFQLIKWKMFKMHCTDANDAKFEILI